MLYLYSMINVLTIENIFGGGGGGGGRLESVLILNSVFDCCLPGVV